MFNKILVETNIINNEKVLQIIKNFKDTDVQEIESIDQYWGKYKKPYLQKREKLNLFIAKKKGTLVKEAPDAYGLSGEKHYYFIHAYNCIYECQYCYLQGHFNTPDIVIFINHEDITNEMEQIAKQYEKTIWFHAGEFSDSLALSHITQELPIYFDFFQKYPQHKLELRTKSSNIKELLKLNPLANVITSFSLSPAQLAKEIDLKTPSLKARLNAISQLSKHGHPIGVHFDPIYWAIDFEEAYQQLIEELSLATDITAIEYFSIGVVRFTKEVYREFSQNYPDSSLHKSNMINSFDGKVRYPRPMRMWMMNKVKEMLLNKGIDTIKIYLCMENDS